MQQVSKRNQIKLNENLNRMATNVKNKGNELTSQNSILNDKMVIHNKKNNADFMNILERQKGLRTQLSIKYDSSNSLNEDLVQSTAGKNKRRSPNNLNTVDNSFETCFKMIELEFEDLGYYFEEKKPKFISRDFIINFIKKKLGLQISNIQATEALLYSKLKNNK